MIECIVFVCINPCIINYHHQSGVRGWCGEGDIFAIFNNSHIWLHAQLIIQSTIIRKNKRQKRTKLNDVHLGNERNFWRTITTRSYCANFFHRHHDGGDSKVRKIFQWISQHHSKISFFAKQYYRKEIDDKKSRWSCLCRQNQDKQTGDVNFSCAESCWIETYFYYNS